MQSTQSIWISVRNYEMGVKQTLFACTLTILKSEYFTTFFLGKRRGEWGPGGNGRLTGPVIIYSAIPLYGHDWWQGWKKVLCTNWLWLCGY